MAELIESTKVFLERVFKADIDTITGVVLGFVILLMIAEPLLRFLQPRDDDGNKINGR